MHGETDARRVGLVLVAAPFKARVFLQSTVPAAFARKPA